VQETRDQAEKDKNQAKVLLDQYQEQLRKAEDQGADIINAARETAREEADRIIAEGKAGAAAFLERARKQAEAEQAAAMAVFKAEAAALVLAATGRLIRREFSGDDAREQAALLLRELGNRNVPS
jgi:F-type H+-transporting ATPase subunit b